MDDDPQSKRVLQNLHALHDAGTIDLELGQRAWAKFRSLRNHYPNDPIIRQRLYSEWLGGLQLQSSVREKLARIATSMPQPNREHQHQPSSASNGDKLLLRLVLGLVGFVVGAGFVIGLEVALLAIAGEITGRRWMPRGLGWVVMPIVAGCAGAALGYRLPDRPLQLNLEPYLPDSKAIRVASASALLWTIATWAFFLIFNPYGTYWTSEEIWKMIAAWLVPISLMVLALPLFKWAFHD